MKNKLKYLSFLTLFFCGMFAPVYSQNEMTRNIELLIQNQKYEEAIGELIDLLQKSKTDPSLQKELPIAYYYLAYSNFSLKQYTEAAEAAVLERKWRLELEGFSDSYYNSTFSAAVYQSYAGNYDRAVVYLEEVLAKMKTIYRPKDIELLNVGIQLGGQYAAAGATFKAAEIYGDIYSTIRSNYTPADSIYQVMSNYISNFYYQAGYFEKAEPFFIEALQLTEQISGGKNNESYLASFKNLLDFYAYAGLGTNAIEKYPSFIDLVKLLRGSGSNDHITVLNSYGELLLNEGRYPESEKVFKEFVKLCEKAFGKNSADYATALNNLAVTLEKQNKYSEAEKLYLQSLSIKEKVYKKESNYYALTLLNIGVLYDYMGKAATAEKYLNEALGIYSQLKDTSDEYSVALSNIASVYSSQGKPAEALKMLDRSSEIALKRNGEFSSQYLTALNNLASVYVDLGNYSKGQELFIKIIAAGEKVYGKEHTELGVSIFNLANLKTELGKYDEAGDLYQRALTIQEKSVGKDHIKYLNVLQSIAALNALKGNYRMAEEYYTICEKGYVKTYGKLHPENSAVLNNFGQYYFEKGDYQHAFEKLNRALEIQLLAYGTEHVNNIPVLSNLANLHVARHEYKLAEEKLQQALGIATKSYGKEHPEYAALLNNSGTLYYKLNNLEKAEEMYLSATELRKKIYGHQHTEYSTSLNNLGSLYLLKSVAAKTTEGAQGNANKAKECFIQSLKIDSLALGPQHPSLATHMNNLAEAYRVLNNPEAAEKLYLNSIELETKAYGNSYSNTASTYHNLALLFAGMNDAQKAELYALKSIDIFEKNYGKDCAAMVDAATSLGTIYNMQQKTDQAYQWFKKATFIQQRELENNFSFLSEDEKSKYLDGLSIHNNAFNSFIFQNRLKYPQYTADVYANQTYYKGILLRSSTRIKEMVLSSGDTALQSLYTKWIDSKQSLAKLYSSGKSSEEIKVKEESTNRLEKSIIDKSSLLNTMLQPVAGDWKKTVSNMKDGQLAIEFFEMNWPQTDSLTLAALVIHPQLSYPEIVPLCSVYELRKALGSAGANGLEYVKSVYGTKANVNDKVFALIWKPLEKFTSTSTEIFYSPAGDLHRVPLHGLMNEKGELLSHTILLHQVGLTSTIQNSEIENNWKSASMLLVGGVDYDTKRSSNRIWDYLPGTKRESEQIFALVTRSGIKITSYSGVEASETHVKELNGKNAPDLIHIATHGFFYNDPEQTVSKLQTISADVNFRGTSRGISTFVENSNPLMRSGLALAGANEVWTADDERKEDGILTAFEVSLMDLQKTKLVVLSACETGLGEIKGSEGVYGLQRAFKMAGVEKLIMSLWKVPDKETEEFMTYFYEQLLKVKNIHKAFSATRNNFSKKYDPYYWAAFVLLE